MRYKFIPGFWQRYPSLSYERFVCNVFDSLPDDIRILSSTMDEAGFVHLEIDPGPHTTDWLADQIYRHAARVLEPFMRFEVDSDTSWPDMEAHYEDFLQSVRARVAEHGATHGSPSFLIRHIKRASDGRLSAQVTGLKSALMQPTVLDAIKSIFEEEVDKWSRPMGVLVDF